MLFLFSRIAKATMEAQLAADAVTASMAMPNAAFDEAGGATSEEEEEEDGDLSLSPVPMMSSPEDDGSIHAYDGRYSGGEEEGERGEVGYPVCQEETSVESGHSLDEFASPTTMDDSAEQDGEGGDDDDDVSGFYTPPKAKR